MTERKALNRTQIVLILQAQATGPILCGCGCGVELDPVNERIVDEHVIPRKQSAAGHEAERDVLENRRFYRWPCALAKTRLDLAVIAKAAAQGGETGQYARRQKRGKGTIPSRPGGWAKGRKLPTKKSTKNRQASSSNRESAQ